MPSRPSAERSPLRRASLLAVALALLSSMTAAEVVERVVGVVDGRPLLLSEVQLRQRLSGGDVRQAAEALADEALMYREAGRLPQAAVTASEEAQALQSLRLKLPAGFVAEEALLRRMARRQVAILKYIEFRFRPQVRVTEEAVRAAHAQAEGGGTPARPYAEAAADVRRALEAAEMDARIEAWVKELRAAAEIRYNDDRRP